MANTAYSMNQFRYNTGSTCMQEIEAIPYYLDWQIETDTSPFYRDVVFQLPDNQSFEANKSYYLTFGIPRDLNYDFDIAIKLLAPIDGNFRYNEAKTKYQFVKYINNRRSSTNGTSNSLVTLYKIVGEDHARVAIQSYDYPGTNTQPNVNNNSTYTTTNGQFYEVLNPGFSGYTYGQNRLYHNRLNDTYWMFRGKNGVTTLTADANYDPFGTEDSQRWDNILAGTNDVVLNWVWETNSTTEMAYYKCVFTPAQDNFNAILLQLQRITEDPDILTSARVGYPAGKCINQVGSTGYGSSINGRYINLEQNIEDNFSVADTFKLYKLKNLNENGSNILASNGKTIVRFGIWGHPELMMAINGEEVQIGSSGYYELNEFNVNSLCVVADGPKDTFVLDYQYIR